MDRDRDTLIAGKNDFKAARIKEINRIGVRSLPCLFRQFTSDNVYYVNLCFKSTPAVILDA